MKVCNAAVTADNGEKTGGAIPGCWIWVRTSSDGDECAGGAVHLARRSPAEGGDSEIGGDGDGVVTARSLSTSASGGRDMEVWVRDGNLAPMPETHGPSSNGIYSGIGSARIRVHAPLMNIGSCSSTS
ncbi:hypothetical protein Tco_0624448 [Tanacetum coccineum]|uniref:Uncharacterized protein n=1 Tax=Tanacetum coccineum TaxID=301880 RepID=A0ABQ4WDY9_9ASTR